MGQPGCREGEYASREEREQHHEEPKKDSHNEGIGHHPQGKVSQADHQGELYRALQTDIIMRIDWKKK